MKNRKKIFVLMAAAFMLFAGCKPAVTPGEKGDVPDTPAGGDNINPEPYASRSANLDFIFSTASVGKVTITMKRSEWNQMLKNYDYFYKNENCVKFTEFEYEKDGVKWDLKKGGGIRLRGNTSRYRPQGKDYPKDNSGFINWKGTIQYKPNSEWDQSYYSYAAECSDNDYRQSHFKVDFEEFLEGDEEQKLAGCMKGVALKRMDGSCTKEIFCYDLFHRYGIWTAPRASHTRVFFKFIEDDNSVTTVNYGVYEMFEEVNKQSLKARDKDENTAKNAWKNSKGNLWKCAGGDLTNPNATMYAEQVEITEFDENGNPKAFIWDSPTYDLKTNKDNVEGAAAEFRQFITELNGLPDVSNKDDTASINAIKAFYEKWMDVEFFLKTYAVNILVGMDDDYWANANNYYLYFGDAKDGSRKVYFIPFDYDNTLGASIQKSNGKVGIEQNPLEWGRGANRPLMDKLLQVPEYRQLFKDLLKEVSSSENEWNYEKCSQRWRDYWSMVGPYLNSPDLSDHVCTKGYWDNVYNFSKSLVNKENNLYDYTRACFMAYLREPGEKMKFDLNGGNIDGNTASVEVEFPDYITTLASLIQTPKKDGYIFAGWTKTKDGEDYQSSPNESVIYARWKSLSDIHDLFIYELEPGMEGYDNSLPAGIQIAILNPPAYRNNGTKGSWRRNIYVNGVKISEDDNEEAVTGTHWYYPFVKKGENYSIRISYKGSDYGTEVQGTNTLNVAGVDAFGDFKYENANTTLGFAMNGNTFTYDVPQGIYAGGLVKEGYTPGYFEVRFHDSNWKFSNGYDIHDYKINSFGLNALIIEKMNWTNGEGIYMMDFAFEHDLFPILNYIVTGPDSANGNYRLEIPVNNKGVRAIDTRLKLEKDINGKYPGLNIEFDIPPGATDRRVYVNTVEVSELGDNEAKWVYPFTEAGNEYEIYVRYMLRGVSYQTEPKVYTGDNTGIGDFKKDTSLYNIYQVINNNLTWTSQSEITVCGKPLSSTNMPGKFEIGFMDDTWSEWYGGKTEVAERLQDYNVKDFFEYYFIENSWNEHSLQELIAKGKHLVMYANYKIEISGVGSYSISLNPWCNENAFEITE